MTGLIVRGAVCLICGLCDWLGSIAGYLWGGRCLSVVLTAVVLFCCLTLLSCVVSRCYFVLPRHVITSCHCQHSFLMPYLICFHLVFIYPPHGVVPRFFLAAVSVLCSRFRSIASGFVNLSAFVFLSGCVTRVTVFITVQPAVARRRLINV